MEQKTLSIDEISRLAAGVYYTNDVLRELAKHIEINRTVVSYGKTRHDVYYDNNGLLLAISPTNSKKRGGFVIRGKEGLSSYECSNGAIYAYDPCMNLAHFEAARAIMVAFSKNNPASALTKLGQDSNHCSVCGAILTDELSCSRGIGPECWQKIGVKAIYGKWLQS